MMRTPSHQSSAFVSSSSLLLPRVSSRLKHAREVCVDIDNLTPEYEYSVNTLGWTKAEVENLVIVLKKFGVGRWVQIVDSGALPGKQIQQLNGQTQRLLGKQSLAEYTGLRLDIDRIRMDNDALTDVTRKNGLITNQGGIRSKETLNALREENLKK